MDANCTSKRRKVKSMETVYIAGGCLWGVQHFFDTVPGVRTTEAGGEPTEQQTRWTARMMDTQSALKWSLMRNVPVLQSLWSICLKSSTRTA